LIKSAAIVLLLIVASVAAVVLSWNAGLMRHSFIRLVSLRSGRPIEVRGAMHLHLLTGSPQIEAEQVIIGNPTWTEPGTMAEITHLTVALAPLMTRQSGLKLLRIDGAQLHLSRDEAGRANWQRVDPSKSSSDALPIVGELEVAHTHVTLKDERLHLMYDGDMSAAAPDSEPLRMEGSGTLNQHAVTFRLRGDALPTAASDKPYAFDFDEHSSGAHFVAHGVLPRGWDLRAVDAKFEANGADLRDLYYLTGVSLPNTGAFRLRGRMARRSDDTLFDDLKVASGQSDVQGRVSLEAQKNGRTLVHVDLTSALMRLADVGLRAAGRDPHPDAPPKLFSDVQLITPATRRVDAVGKYSARRLLLARVEVSDLSVPFTIERGLLKAPEVTGQILGGRFALHLDTDANKRPAHSRIEMTLKDLQLAQMPHKAEPPPYEGSVLVQIRAQGRGDSLHALAAAADGRLSAQVRQGTLRASLAELTGIDLRGLGLTLTGSRREVPVSCAAADFEIHSGVMDVSRLFIDSEAVFISGDGRVFLDPEILDIKLHGEPKKLRILRVKAPVNVQGTLLQPKFSIDAADSRTQLVDRGTPRNADCTALQSH
jgi:hypothetical protein